MKTKIIFLLSLLPALFFGQTDLVRWNSNNNLNATVVVSNITSAPMSASGVQLSGAWQQHNTSTGVPYWTTSGAIDLSQYVQFTVTANAGYQIEPDAFKFRYNASGPQKYQVRYSKTSDFTGGGTILIEETNFAGGDNDVTGNFPNDFKVLPGETLYIRFYAYANSLTWYSPVFFKHGNNTTNGPKITGTVSEFANVLTANNDNVVAEPNQTTALDVLANDTEGNAPINSIILDSNPAFGNVVWNNGTQKFDYTPNANYLGTDSFTYTISNGTDDSDTATVNISVSGTTPTGNLSGIYFIDDQYGHFSTITSAVAYLNTHTVDDEVTFLLYDNLYSNSTGETFPIEITASADYTVTFKPAPNKNVNIDAYNENGPGSWPPVRAVFKLNGAENITFNGSNNNSSSKNLNITNHCNYSTGGAHRTVLWITNQSDTIEIRNMILVQFNDNISSDFSGAIFAGDSNTIGIGNASNNPVSNLTVNGVISKGVKQGVFINCSGTGTNRTNNVEVYDNDFGTENDTEKITHSIYLRGVQGFKIYENIIFDLEINHSESTPYSGIYVGGESNNGVIYKNQILGIYRDNAAHQVAGIHLESTYGDENTPNNIAVVNNFIADVYNPGSHNSITSGAYGIYMGGGHGYKLYHNSVSLSENVSAGICAAIVLIGSASDYSELDIRNNIFINSQTNGNYASGIRKFGIAVNFNLTNNMSDVFKHLDYNNYYVPSEGGYIAGHTSINNGDSFPSYFFTELLGWQNFVGSSFETNSGSENTPFVSNFNLHISDSDAWVNNEGVGLATEFANLWVNLPYDDIDGQPRSITAPDIGADEFGIPPVEPGICEITLYWNGTSWGDENGDLVIFDDEEITEPNRDFLTEIRGAYDTEEHGSFTTCQLTIGTGGSLRIDGNDYVYIVRSLINTQAASAVIVENNGSIVQEIDFNENEGSITYKRKTKPMFNYDYTYWGSPVAGQTTAALSPNSGNYRYRWDPEVYFNTTYNTYVQQRWVAHNSTMNPGEGYIIKAPNNFPNNPNNTPLVFNANFVGVPNSGPYSFDTTGDPGNLLSGNDASNPANGYPQGDYAWNFFANPYPSALDVKKFRDANNIYLGENVYLWTHNTKPVQSEIYYTYVANDFAVYNAALGTGTSASLFNEGTTTPNPNLNVPSRFIASGQAFFMAAKNGTVQFNNSMRVSTINSVPNSIMPNNEFYKVQDNTNSSDQEEVHIIKLSIRNEQGAFHQMLLGYTAEASNGLDDIDGVLFGGNYVSLYSVIENYHLVVQGRDLPFSETDQVPLGFILNTISGDFSIHLDYFDGLFEEDNQNQDIYLYDSYLDITHNLKSAPYEFTSDEGAFNDRFVLKYMSPLSIGDINNLDNSWAVYQKDNQLQVAASGFDIKDIAVYDVLGRLVYQKENINTNSHTIEKMNSNQVLIVKVTSTDNTTSVKKVFN
ncbi:MAG: T9SS sorting signal type C domain-containing protein [Flavobacteriaceae bacterium]